ncbi:MAG: ABC transporter substrate-binding protein [Dehalococcoidia bacterium]|nr:ABC transporter substrate-binding protein [Dehalococcoidia bacterium]
MKRFPFHWQRPYWVASILVPILLFILACGPGEQPTPTPTPKAVPTATAITVPVATPTSTAPGPVATPTPTRPGPVATPTPTLVSTPTSAAPAAEKPRSGGTMEEVYRDVVPNFDVQLLSATPSFFTANGKLYNNLLINYEGQKIECEVCSEWHLENNSKTMVFTLIPGIKFHTGQELTSEDVKYSLRMIIGDVDGIVSPRSGVLKEYLQSIEAPSKYGVRLNLARPSSFVPKVLSLTSSAIFRAGTTRDDLNKAPAGSGPYLLKRVIPGASWEMERNPDYFKAGLPYIDKIKQTVVVDPNTIAAAFLTHKVEYDLYPQRPPDQFLPAYYKLRDDGKVTIEPFLKGTALWGIWMNVTKPPFNNLKMRQAVNLVADRRNFADVTHSKFGDPLGGARAQLLVFYEDDGAYGRPESQIWDVLPGWGTGAKKQQEIQQAKQLVIDSGYPNGLDIKEMARGTSAYNELVQQELFKIGIRATLDPVTPAQHADKLAKLDYTINPYLFRQTTSDPDEVIGLAWVTGGSRNINGYSNPEVDKLFIQMSSELDSAKKVALFKQIEDIIIFKDQGYAPEPGNIAEGYWWKRLEGVHVGMAMHVAGSSGNARSDRWWLRD